MSELFRGRGNITKGQPTFVAQNGLRRELRTEVTFRVADVSGDGTDEPVFPVPTYWPKVILDHYEALVRVAPDGPSI